MRVQKDKLGSQASDSMPDLTQTSYKPASQQLSPRSPMSALSKHTRHYSASTASSAQNTQGINLYQGFDQDSRISSRPARVSDTPQTSSASVSEMEMRLHQLHSQVARLQEENWRLSGHSSSSFASQLTLDTQNLGDQQKGLPADDRGFDLCRWIRGTSPKTEILYRRHLLSVNEPITSPLFRLRRPAVVSELLQKYAEFERPVAQFMDEHKSLDSFKPYVLNDAHTLPCVPGVAPVNDHATQHLPPLAAEEYMAHVSRLTYLVRTLHAIDIADPVFLSDPRTHLLLDMVMDLEQTFTLPRVDFLRKHALTMQAMNASSQFSDSRSNLRDRPESDYVIGDAQNWSKGAEALPKGEDKGQNATGYEHIRHMARAISPHPDFRSSTSTANDMANTNFPKDSPSCATNDASDILGDKLRPDSEFYAANGIQKPKRISKNPFDPPFAAEHAGSSNAAAAVATTQSAPSSRGPSDRAKRRSKNPFDPPPSPPANASEESVVANDPNVSQFGPSPIAIPDTVAETSKDSDVADPALHFDPKLHPVLGPRSMDVSPTPPLYQKTSFSGTTINQQSMPNLKSKGSGFSQLLRRKAVPVPHPLLPSPVSND
ncbi:hypothetical protein LPJ53_003974 [Coemansia erecta]|uniref:Uncharacterized protein n=1 Tax=Coemansia erecta TaxID=147472 RepID=A0A9W7XV86_9FUNG|nr:hypothetical protein LPJ53_003974 [Coemansia erecta]